MRWSRPAVSVASVVTTAVALGSMLAALACGPSYQSVYEADVTFEHCYALDDRADAPLLGKRDCWQTWRSRFAVGQSRDKLEYAAARAEALSRGTALPTDDSMAAAAPGEAHVSQVVAPQLTNAFAPPPKTLDVGDGGVVDPNDMVNATAPQITWSAASALAPSGTGGWTQDAGASSPAPASAPASTGKTSAPTKTLALRDLPAARSPTGPGPAPGAACTGGCTKSFGECRDTCKGGTSCTACDGGYRSCMRSCFK